MTRIAVAAALVLVLTPAFASEPGQPLGADDLVFSVPGLSATQFLPRGCGYPWCWEYPPGSQTPYALVVLPIDVEGNQYAFREQGLTNCNGTERDRTHLVRLRPDGSEEDVAYIEDRCVPNTTSAVDRVWFRSLRIDNTVGCFYLLTTTDLWGSTSPSDISYPVAPTRESLVRICGFTTTFDVLQTYTPQASLGFHVPYMPEGMAAADRFDTYYGPLTNPIDFTQAQPLQCNFPTAPPTVGDYLTVADPLPNPPTGQGRYYVTAATYQGQTRYGRKRQGTVMSGRDPAVLPACAQPDPSLTEP